MSHGPEYLVKKEVRVQLSHFPNAYIIMPVTGGFGSSGPPDFVVCIEGLFFGIECKATEESRVTALQMKHLGMIARAGGHAMVVHRDNVEQLADRIRAILSRGK